MVKNERSHGGTNKLLEGTGQGIILKTMRVEMFHVSCFMFHV